MSFEQWKAMGRVPSSLEADPAFVALIDPAASVLDLGCGDGRTLAAVAGAVGRGPGRETPPWAGVDANGPSLEVGRDRRLPGTAFVQGDLAGLPFAGKSFDYGLMHAVLTTLDTRKARRAVLAEAARVLKAGLSFSDFLLTPEIPLYQERYARGRKETGEWGTFRVMDGERCLYTAHHYTVSELRGLFREAGFGHVDMRRVTSRTRSGNAINGVVGLARLS